MKLQVNRKGAWRDVLSFPAHRLAEVAQAAGTLADVMDGGCLALVDSDGKRYYRSGPKGALGWHDANAWPMPGLAS